jgi:phage pi2 protein 07
LKLLEHFKSEKLYDDNIKPETNIEKGGIVYFKKNSFNRKYNSNYRINNKNFKLIQYPKWK